VVQFTGHAERVLSVCFSPRGNLLASAGEAGWVRLWNVPKQQLIKAWKAHQGAVRQVTFNLDGTLLASAGEDRKVKLWQVPDADAPIQSDSASTAEPLKSYGDHGAAVLCVLFN